MKPLMIGLAGLGCLAAAGMRAETGPEWMDCRHVTVVRYHPGARWADFSKHVTGHLAFLREQMEAGRLTYAGPLEGENGGFSIYASSDLAEVDRRVRQDPLVVKGVVTYSLHSWQMCSLAKGQKSETPRRQEPDTPTP